MAPKSFGQGRDAQGNLELIRYYRDRKVWLVEPDAMPARITLTRSPKPVEGN